MAIKFKIDPEINHQFETGNRKQKFEIMKTNFFELTEQNKYKGILELECHYYCYAGEAFDKNELIHNISEYRYNKYNIKEKMDDLNCLNFNHLSKSDFNFIYDLFSIYSYSYPVKFFNFLLSNHIKPKNRNIPYGLVLDFMQRPGRDYSISNYINLFTENQKHKLIDYAIKHYKILELRKFSKTNNPDIYKMIKKRGY